MDRNGTDSFHCNIYDALDFISAQCPAIACVMNDVTLSDVFSEQNPRNKFIRGLAHNKILEEFRHRVSHPNSLLHKEHSACVFDESKIILVYLLAHDASINLAKLLKLPPKNYHYRIEFVDNEIEILTALRDTLLANRDLLPKAVTVNLYFYTGILQKTPFASITGTGPVDECYVENILKMVRMCGHDGKDFGKNIHVAKELDVKKFLQERIVTIQDRIITDNPAVFFSDGLQAKRQGKEAQPNSSLKTEVQPSPSPDYQPL